MVRKADRQFAEQLRLLRFTWFLVLVLPFTASGEYREIDEVRPFGLLGVDGRVRVGYLFDGRDRALADTGTAESQISWEEEIYVRTRSFIYHPGFLNMVIGGGPVFVQREFDSLEGEGNDRDTLFNAEAQLNFLDIKTYPFSIYFQQTHPSVTRGLAGRFIVRNQVYGFRGTKRQLFTDRTSVTVDLKRRAAKGSGFGYSVDDETAQGTLTAETWYRRRDRVSFTYDYLNLDSASGSPGLPVHVSTQEQKLAQLVLENRFGGNDQVEVFQLLSRHERELANASTSSLEDRRYRGKVTWKHNERTRSNYRYNFADLKRSSSDSIVQDAGASLVRQLGENATIDAGLEHLRQKETGSTREENAFRGVATHISNTPLGRLALGAGLRAARNDQVSEAGDIPVFDEAIVLVGTTPVDLAREFVVSGSIVVRNLVNTQVYVEGSDYRLIQIGSVTSIQRLLDGNITDGETVLVDYRYQTSGTAEFDTLDSNVSASLAFLENFEAYIRYDVKNTNVRSGELTNRVNDRDRMEYGLNVNNRALDGWSLGGQYRHVRQDEEISPFVSNALSVNFSKSLWGRLSVSASAGVTRTDFEFSDEDTDQRLYTLGLSGNPILRTSFSYFASYLEDIGGTVPRMQLRHRLNFQWSYRMMLVTLLAEYMNDELGTSVRTDRRVTLQIVRRF